MKALTWLFWAAGFLLLFFLFSRLDPGVVWDSLGRAGWTGFALVLVAGLILTACLASGLYPLLSGDASLKLVFAARQVRDSAGDILPFTQIGGMALGMRVLVLGGIAPSRAIAAGVVDVTTEMIAQDGVRSRSNEPQPVTMAEMSRARRENDRLVSNPKPINDQ